MKALSIVIPCYNEEKNLRNLVEKCVPLLESNPDVEILLVNNGSTDNSQQVLDELLMEKNMPTLRTHHVPVNKGYGYGILQGLVNTDAPVLCWTHADLQTDVQDCIKAYELFKESPDNNVLLVKGKRLGRPFLDVLFTRLMSVYVHYKLGVRISDVNAQPKLFSKAFFDSIYQNAPHDFSLDLYFLLEALKRGSIATIPVYFHDRVAGEAKGGGSLKLKMKLTKRTIAFINNIGKN